MDWSYLLNNFDGRIGRKTFWIAMAVVTAAEILGHLIAEQFEGDRLSAIVDLAFTYPEFAIALKRSHDRNLPPWLTASFFARRRGARPDHGAAVVRHDRGAQYDLARHRGAVHGFGRRPAGRARFP
jgi:hypothetical protein